MRVETGLSPALALKLACIGKMRNFVILKKCVGKGLKTTLQNTLKVHTMH